MGILKYRYFFLNIKLKESTNCEDKSEAFKWLKQNKAPIFFGESTIAECEKGKKPLRTFCELGKATISEQKKCRIVTIDDGRIYIYMPNGKIREEKKSFAKTVG